MSGGDYRNRPSLHIPGKEFLIVIVVIFSSISFTLGYFVGKSNRDAGSGSAVRVAEQTSPQKTAELPDVQPQAEAPGRTGQPASPGAPAGSAKAKTVPSAVGKTASRAVSAQARHTEKAAPSVRPSHSKEHLQKSTISYTVQIGALSNKKDAEVLRTKYEKKGYWTYVLKAKDKRGKTIYKIRIGRFKNRKDAEMLSLKLRRTEELNSFVTFKNE